MQHKPILFSGPMVRALLDGRKTQTRRIVKPKPDGLWAGLGYPRALDDTPVNIRPDDRLWVREKHQAHSWAADCVTIRYAAEERTAGFTAQIEQIAYPDGDRNAFGYIAPKGPNRWRPGIHMPRWASRLTLTVTDVRVQRLQDIGEADAWAEGCTPGDLDDHGNPFPAEEPHPKGGSIGWDCARDWFADLWDSLNGDGAWDGNPWVSVYSFTVARENIDAQKEAA